MTKKFILLPLGCLAFLSFAQTAPGTIDIPTQEVLKVERAITQPNAQLPSSTQEVEIDEIEVSEYELLAHAKDTQKLINYCSINSCPVNSSFYKGQTLYHIAAQRANIDTLNWLDSKSAVFKLTHQKESVLHFASRSKNFEVIDYIAKKTDKKLINQKNTASQDALFYLFKDYNSSIPASQVLKSASLLMSYGMSCNTQDKQGNTPLHYAMVNMYSELLRDFISMGCDPLIKNNEAVSVFDLAKKYSHKNTLFVMQLETQYLQELSKQTRK